MVHSRTLAFGFLAMATCHGIAQTPPSPTLPEGSPVALVFTTALSSRTVAVGDPVGFALAEDLKVDGVVVAKAGTAASARVIQVKRAALGGRSGSISLCLKDLPIGHDQVELWGTREGARSEVRIRRPYRLKWPLGLLRSGDEIVIKEGMPLTVFVGRKHPTTASR